MVDLGACVTFGIDQVKKNPTYHILGGLVIMLAQSVTMGIVLGPLMVGYFDGIRKEQEGGKAEIGDIFAGFNRFTPSLVAWLIGTIIVFVGSLLCLIPGLLAIPVVQVAYFVVHRGENDGVQAIKTSWELCKPQLVMAACTCFVLGLVALLGGIACVIGVFVTLPIALAGFYKLGEQLSAGQTPRS